MAATIWKFPLLAANQADVVMPEGAKVLTVATIGDDAFLWAIVDPEAPEAVRHFTVRGTGHPIGDVGGYIGTFTLYEGALVFHVFEASS